MANNNKISVLSSVADPNRKALFGDIEMKNTAGIQFSTPEGAAEQKMEEGRGILINAQRTLAQTKETGVATLDNLGKQGETIGRIGVRTAETSSIVDVARTTIWRMAKRENRLRLYMAGFILALIILIIILGYVIHQKLQPN